MSEIQEYYWLISPVRAEYSRKCFEIITPSTIVATSGVKWELNDRQKKKESWWRALDS
jgi:hypothetical protein